MGRGFAHENSLRNKYLAATIQVKSLIKVAKLFVRGALLEPICIPFRPQACRANRS